jgi:hypothetical protein
LLGAEDATSFVNRQEDFARKKHYRDSQKVLFVCSTRCTPTDFYFSANWPIKFMQIGTFTVL